MMDYIPYWTPFIAIGAILFYTVWLWWDGRKERRALPEFSDEERELLSRPATRQVADRVSPYGKGYDAAGYPLGYNIKEAR